jgi:hypothetical protein
MKKDGITPNRDGANPFHPKKLVTTKNNSSKKELDLSQKQQQPPKKNLSQKTRKGTELNKGPTKKETQPKTKKPPLIMSFGPKRKKPATKNQISNQPKIHARLASNRILNKIQNSKNTAQKKRNQIKTKNKECKQQKWAGPKHNPNTKKTIKNTKNK